MPPLRVHSYASDARAAAADAPQWTLFVRQENERDTSAFVLTACVPTSASTCGIYETRLDTDAMDQHIDELGIEVAASAFTDLLLKTLATRASVDVAIDTNDGDDGKRIKSVCVVLTYKFSETISRKGQLELECVSSTAPLAVATLLQTLHSVPNAPVRTASQALEQEQTVIRKKPIQSLTPSISLSQESNQSTDGDVAVAPTNSTATVNPQLLKRRHVPTGTARRKGPRGAKLAKLE